LSTDPSPPSKPQALVVEDDETMRDFLTSALNKLGYDTWNVADGMAALHLVDEKSFELVVCDIRMPKLSGISFVRNARMRNPESIRRVIFVSAIDDTVIRREANDVGGAAFLYKPITMQTLRETIAGLG
jgi:CheY-like chemotaxis protein